MRYMATSLAFTAGGLMLVYFLYSVQLSKGKTLNAVLFESLSSGWNPSLANVFLLVTLISEAAILLVAAQTGFLDGPRVLSNMALDRWFPSRFSFLSDRLVTHNGILLITGAAAVTMLASRRIGQPPRGSLCHQRLCDFPSIAAWNGPALAVGSKNDPRLV